ncbi:heavy-metal-associated domain-containing protein [Aliiroseovarius sp. S1339]|uniref:heavy-metal-associated domain-containing protein n=1 Tax=Aliiroseovarius sp. S1339 TaxID=2936990 RepID=UPI0020BE3B13|nr:heavy-metal-associated domain-containing protein [Aliiroseovarius sp. S1339]MCK8464263.1 heavy-metal-associated domain-containing protein [Aliiroseovarius sp. S1339]
MTTFHVPDMSCGHCKASITEVLTELGGEQLTFDMEARTVDVSNLSPEAVVTALDGIGFPASPK